jgi:PAS domain S-box-containing protein
LPSTPADPTLSDLPFAHGALRAQSQRDQVAVRVLLRLTTALALLTWLSIPLQAWLGIPSAYAPWRWITGTLLLATTGVGLWLSAHGQYRRATALLLGLTQLFVGLYAWGSGLGLLSIMLSASPLLVVLAGVLANARAAWVLTGVQLATLAFLYVGGAAGSVEPAANAGSRLVAHMLLSIGALFSAITLGRHVALTLHDSLVKEHRLAELLRLGSDWTWEADRKGVMTYLSPGFERHTGCKAAGFLGPEKPGGPRLVHDAEWELLIADIRARRAYRGRVFTFELPGGQILCVRGNGEPVLDEAGRHVGWWGISQNVTGEVLAAREHERSRALLDSLVRLSPDAITVVSLRDGRVMLANPGFLTLSGFGQADLVLGRSALELGLWRDEAEARRLACAVQEAGVVRDLRTRFWHQGRQPRDVLLTAAKFDWNDEPVAVVICRDITDLERSRLQGDAILNHAAVGMALVRERRLERVNPQLEHMLGRPVGSLAGSAVASVFDDDADYQGFLAQVQALVVAGRPVEVEHELRRTDGTSILAQLRSQLVDPRHPEEAGAIWVVEDITERRRVEKNLEQARQIAEAASDAKSAFLAHVSHEIRTPLNGVLGLARLMAEPGQSAARSHEYLAYLIDAAESLNGIVSNVLDLSKMEAGKLQVEAIEFDLVDLVDKVHGAHTVLAEAKGLTTRRQIGPGVPHRVRGDPLRLRQIISNFMANAIKFTSEGQVELRVSTAGPGRLRFEVEDSGIGIDPAVLSSLFQPFAQADHSTTRRFGGTGLGLSITRELAQLMGGEVGAHSANGQGACFWAELPLPDAGTATTPPGPAGAPVASPLRGLRLLLAEDNPVNMLIAVEILTRLGAEVSQASDGAQAVMACRAAPDSVDVVLMDLHMPQLDGLAAARALQQDPGTRHIPVVAFSAAALDHERAQARAAGMSEFVSKPVQPDELVSVLARFVPA